MTEPAEFVAEEESGDAADRSDGAAAFPGVPLPRFIVRETGAVWVELAHLEDSASFRRLAGSLFEADCCLRGLDYPVFQRLAFELEAADVATEIARCEETGTAPRWRLCDALAHIDPIRVDLYRSFRVADDLAEYLFEPLTVDLPVAEGASGPDGASARPLGIRVHLDFDEFVARAWLKGVRFGLDESVVRKAIADEHNGRLVIARQRLPEPGEDARVEEVGAGLRRDDAPNLLSDGRVNLLQFRNRFPQVRSGAQLMRKIPAQPGRPGRSVAGESLPPAVPRDFDLTALVGAETRIERDENGEYLVAAMDGFLDIDAGSGKISVTEKIISRQGVNIRTTGDISLVGQEYEEYGEIQEKRVVEGWNITTHADVYGNLVSSGGVITIKKRLSGGTITNNGGRIVIEGSALNATVLGGDGEVEVRHAEGCLIAARRVIVTEGAVCCDIVADEMEVREATGCTLAGRAVTVSAVRPRGSSETLVLVRVPPLERFGHERDEVHARLAAIDKVEQLARAEAAQLKALEPVARYLLLAAKVREQEIVLSPEQQTLFGKLRELAAPSLRRLAQLTQDAQARAAECAALGERLAAIESERAAACEGVTCRIEDIAGEIIVRAATDDESGHPLVRRPAADLRRFLHAPGAGKSLLHAADSGRFDWRLGSDGKIGHEA